MSELVPNSSSPYFKVLVDGKSCHGGTMTWSLPKLQVDGTHEPGDWHEVPGQSNVCSSGLHLTSDPKEWWLNGCEVYVAEHAGRVDGPRGDSDKISVEKARLLRPTTEAELAALQIYRSGTHQVHAGKAVASGSASVKASGSASVEAWDSASVKASDSASVEASGSASVEAWDSASVKAWDSASVKASGSASVKASDSASVEASDSASVKAWDSASVTLNRPSCPCDVCRNLATVEATGVAAIMDRRGTVLKITVGGKEWKEVA